MKPTSGNGSAIRIRASGPTSSNPWRKLARAPNVSAAYFSTTCRTAVAVPAANAAIGLYRLGVTGPLWPACPKWQPARMHLSAAAPSGSWARYPALLDVLNQLCGDSEPRVRWLVLKSLSTFNRAGVRPRPSPAEPPVAAEAATVSAPTPPASPSVPASTPPSQPRLEHAHLWRAHPADPQRANRSPRYNEAIASAEAAIPLRLLPPPRRFSPDAADYAPVPPAPRGKTAS